MDKAFIGIVESIRCDIAERVLLKACSAKDGCVSGFMYVHPFMVGVENFISIVGTWLERGGRWLCKSDDSA